MCYAAGRSNLVPACRRGPGDKWGAIKKYGRSCVSPLSSFACPSPPPLPPACSSIAAAGLTRASCTRSGTAHAQAFLAIFLMLRMALSLPCESVPAYSAQFRMPKRTPPAEAPFADVWRLQQALRAANPPRPTSTTPESPQAAPGVCGGILKIFAFGMAFGRKTWSATRSLPLPTMQQCGA